MATRSETTVRSRVPNAGHSSRVESEITKYVGHYSNSSVSNPSKDRARTEQAAEVAESYYQVATDFYEYGWGESFHFAPIFDDNSLKKCIEDFENEIAGTLGAQPGMKILVRKLSEPQTAGKLYGSHFPQAAEAFSAHCGKHSFSACCGKVCTMLSSTQASLFVDRSLCTCMFTYK